MKILRAIIFSFLATAVAARGQSSNSVAGPDPREIPLPPIKTPMGTLPGVNDLPVRVEMPDVMTMNDGTKVTTPEQWKLRREEMKKILEYYAVGQAPPPPGNVKGKELSSQLLLNGTIKYRLVHLTFGPDEKLGMDIGIFTPVNGAGHVPTVIAPGFAPGGTPQTRLPNGPTQGRGVDVLLDAGTWDPNAPVAPAPAAPATPPAAASAAPTGVASATLSAAVSNTPPGGAPGGVRRGGFGRGGGTPESVAASSQPLKHGYAYVVFNDNDCAEDTTLRAVDNSFAFRHTRFMAAYPGYDWGVLRGWAWGASRVVDYLLTDPDIDKDKLIITGVSRDGKSAMIAGAFDDRIAISAPDASSGGGTPAYRFSGIGRGGKEGLTEMVRKYPNWFSPHLHEFWGQPDKLPFDEHWFMALIAPRPFIALEGSHDQNVVVNGVKQSFLAAKPAYDFLGVPDRIGVSWSDRPHGMVQGDWDALFAVADKFLLGKQIDLHFDQFPEETAAPAPATPAAPVTAPAPAPAN